MKLWCVLTLVAAGAPLACGSNTGGTDPDLLGDAGSGTSANGSGNPGPFSGGGTSPGIFSNTGTSAGPFGGAASQGAFGTPGPGPSGSGGATCASLCAQIAATNCPNEKDNDPAKCAGDCKDLGGQTSAANQAAVQAILDCIAAGPLTCDDKGEVVAPDRCGIKKGSSSTGAGGGSGTDNGSSGGSTQDGG